MGEGENLFVGVFNNPPLFPSMPSVEITVDDLVEMFPNVERDVLAKIHASLDDPNIADVADVLDEAAELGKIPRQPPGEAETYTRYVAEFLLDTDDLKEVGASPEQAVKGMQADSQARRGNWDKRLDRVIDHRNAPGLVDLINEARRVGDEALKNPHRASYPSGPKSVLTEGTKALYDMIEESVENDDPQRLAEIERAIDNLDHRSMAKNIQKKVLASRHLIQNEGTDYEKARVWVLDEENTPQEVQERSQKLYFQADQWDITLDQVREILEDAQKWLQMWDEYDEQEQQQANS